MDEIVVEIEHKLTELAGTRIELVALKNGTARVQRNRDARERENWVRLPGAEVGYSLFTV